MSERTRQAVAAIGLMVALAPGIRAAEPPAAPVKCGTPRFLAPPPIEGRIPVVVMGGFGLEPSGRPVGGGVLVAVPPDHDKATAPKPPGAAPSLPEVDPPELRFDVAIEIFDRVADPNPAADAGPELPSSLRRAEARLLALGLRRVLEDSGHWGTVRVVPASGEGFDVVVSGRVVYSGRDHLEVEVEARDALGRRLDARRLRGTGSAAPREVMSGIAGDLLRWRDEGPKGRLPALHAAALLRFGARLAPDVFERYLPPAPVTGDGAAPPRLSAPPPDSRSPLVARLQRLSDQDQTFLTILNRHYGELYDAMTPPYEDWRDPSSARQSAALATLEDIVRSFDAPGAPSFVKAEGYEKMLAGSVEGQFLAWRRLAVRTLRVESASVR